MLDCSSCLALQNVTLKDPIERGLKGYEEKIVAPEGYLRVTLKDPIERGLKGKIAGNVESCAVVVLHSKTR